MGIYAGKWHGKKFYFGLHYDLHANQKDTELGARCGPRDLIPMLQLMGPDFVQTDCKGHPGYTSWHSRVPEASVSPGVVKDALLQWRRATRRLGLPLHCHYSGIWDNAAGRKHPGWSARKPGGKLAGAPFGPNAGKPTAEKMCPRSPYQEKLMLPQLFELIDRYGVDGFWIDGEIWAVEPCYCKRCRKAFEEKTGIAKPPVEVSDSRWPEWWNFTLDSFEEYVTRTCEAVHAHKSGVLVCSNWLQTFRHPGPPKTPTDWISGDNSWVWGMDGSRCEARFLSTRGKPWDIMLWAFYCSHGMGKPDSPWTMKPVEMLQQEAAVLLAFGGNVQVYEHPPGLRNGQLVPWRQERLRALGRFVKVRRRLCQDTETIPDAAVLHSEHHVRSGPTGKNLLWGVDVAPVQGAVFSLLECHRGVDILDEWALRPRLNQFPLVVAPEQHRMSEEMAAALQEYVRQGGRLLISGAESFDRFGEEFLGVRAGTVEEKKSYHVPAGDGSVPIYGERWRLVECTRARPLGALGTTASLDERLLPHPAATLHTVGRGRVVYIPTGVFRDLNHNRYPLTRVFLAQALSVLAAPRRIRVETPTAIDVVLRRKGNRRMVHLINRGSGIPNQPNNGAIDEIPAVGPVTVTLLEERRPRGVRLAFERGSLDWNWRPRARGGELAVQVSRVRIHAAVVVEAQAQGG
ncbi:MAG: alpha-L-fucosidase [Planctomycetes bacterium]|nr:alpha-L-fucosidase [Planctomycetota bacterium]